DGNAAETLKTGAEKMSGVQRPLLLGRAYEILNQIDAARRAYDDAVKLVPGNVEALLTAADFYVRTNQNARALPLFQTLLKPETKAAPSDLAVARRGMALALAASGRYGDWTPALALLDENERLLGKNPDDLRGRAVLLAMQPNRRKEAIAAF